jgi:ribosomal protein L13E
MAKILYVVQVNTWKKWLKTWWTRQGKPVSKRAAELAMGRAQAAFPYNTYRVQVFKSKEKI